MKDLYEHNIDHQHAVRTFLNTPDGEHTVEITSTFRFKSKEQAETFAELMMSVEIDGDDND